MLPETLLEAREVPVAPDPRHLGEGAEARVRLVVDDPRRVHVLGPDVRLHADDVRALRLRQLRGHGLEGVDLGDGERRADRDGLARVVGLPVVEVDAVVRAGDDVVALAGGHDRTELTTPRGDGRVLRQPAALEDLVPAVETPTGGGEVRLELADEPGLQLLDGREPALGHEGLRARARRPAGLLRLVATDADEGGGEQLHHLVEHRAEEVDGRLAHVEDRLVDAPARPHRRLVGVLRDVGHGEFRVGGDDGSRVAGQIDLGDDRDRAGCGVGDDLAEIVLRVEAAVRSTVARCVPRGAVLALRAPTAHLGELREGVDLDAPTLVVGQVEVEDVQLVPCREVDEAEDVGLREEVPGDVEHDAAPAEAGCVLDRRGRDGPVDARHERPAVDGGRQELGEGHRSGEGAGRVGRDDPHTLLAHRQAVAAGGQAVLVDERDAVGPQVDAGVEVVAGRGLQDLAQPAAGRREAAVPAEAGRVAERERALVLLDGRWQGKHRWSPRVDVLRRGCRRAW